MIGNFVTEEKEFIWTEIDSASELYNLKSPRNLKCFVFH